MSNYKKISAMNFSSSYIPIRRRKSEDFMADDTIEDDDERWLAKARRLQARRWRKIKRQMD